jgi:hypothetical protein
MRPLPHLLMLMSISCFAVSARRDLHNVETDPAEADATTVVQNLLHGRYGQPLRVMLAEMGDRTFELGHVDDNDYRSLILSD